MPPNRLAFFLNKIYDCKNNFSKIYSNLLFIISGATAPRYSPIQSWRWLVAPGPCARGLSREALWARTGAGGNCPPRPPSTTRPWTPVPRRSSTCRIKVLKSLLASDNKQKIFRNVTYIERNFNTCFSFTYNFGLCYIFNILLLWITIVLLKMCYVLSFSLRYSCKIKPCGLLIVVPYLK